MLTFRGFGFWGVGVLGFWGCGVLGFWGFGVTSVMAMMDSLGSKESAGIFIASAGLYKFSAGI